MQFVIMRPRYTIVVILYGQRHSPGGPTKRPQLALRRGLAAHFRVYYPEYALGAGPCRPGQVSTLRVPQFHPGLKQIPLFERFR